jgi:hypothetical protein
VKPGDIVRDRISCDRCVALMINGMFCHETGCPNTYKLFDRELGEWIKMRKCFECGCDVRADDPCCSAESEVTDELV